MNELQPLRQQSAWVAGGLGVAGLVILIILIAWLTRTLDQPQPAAPATNERPRTVVNQPSRNASETTPCMRQNEPIHTSWAEALKDPVRVCNIILHNPEPFPENLAQFKNLRSLNIVRHNLTALPPEVGQLKSLQGLVLADNKLTTLPVEIGQLHSLEKLMLNGNPLTHLPVEIGELSKLQSVHLRNTALSAAEQARIRSLVPQATVIF